jgi:hypothetical protein
MQTVANKLQKLVAQAPHRAEIARWAAKIDPRNCRGRRNRRKIPN